MANVAKTFKQSPVWKNPMESKSIKYMKETYERFCSDLREKGSVTMEYATNYSGSHVPMPRGNTKLGGVFYSLSLMPVLNCGNCKGCAGKCYDLRHDVTNKACMELRCLTAAMLEIDPMKFWVDVDRQAQVSRFFRYHIGGDIVNAMYFEMMRAVARKNPKCDFLCFTKMYGIVNDSIKADGALPENLHIIFSRWPGVKMDNPHSLPTSFPIFSDEDCEQHSVLKKFQESSPKFYWHCNDDCTDCAICGKGCFGLKLGDAVGFAYH